jgi:hypothetical protein
MAIESIGGNALAPGIYSESGSEGEECSLRYRILRLRTILRFASDSRVITGLKEVIADAESRLVALERRRRWPGAPQSAQQA